MIKKWNILAGLLILGCSLSLLAQGSINVTWNAVTQSTTGAAMTVDGYRVYRGTITGQTTTVVQTTPTLSFSDTTGTQGTTYYYAITAYKGAAESAKSSEASAMFPIQIPAPPTGVTATPVATLQTPCGMLNDTVNRVPTNWTTFSVPAVGVTYTDPVFGCPVTRITNSGAEEGSPFLSFFNYYSTFTAINATDNLLLINSSNGFWRIKNLAGATVVPVANMPAMNNGHPVWHATNGNIFYYTRTNVLYRGTISGSSVTETSLHVFTEYPGGVVSPDSADLSQDGTHIALAGKSGTGTTDMDIFVWDLTAQVKSSTYNTVCTASGSIAGSNQPLCLHKLQMTANNLMLIQFVADGTGVEQGVRLWNGTSLVNVQNATSHFDTGYSLTGVSVLASRANSTSLPGLTNGCPSGWGLDARLLPSLSTPVCLLDNVPNWHLSYRGGSLQPWAVASMFYVDASENFGSAQPTTANWDLYEGEIIAMKIDGSARYRLAHSRSRSNHFWHQPHAAISRSGRYVVFSSSMAHPTGCPAGMQDPGNCSDVYVIKMIS